VLPHDKCAFGVALRQIHDEIISRVCETGLHVPLNRIEPVIT
jgi:hypothetical protein